MHPLKLALKLSGYSRTLLHGNPTEVVPAALKEWRCGRLCYEADTEPYGLKRDASVAAAARAMGVEVRAPVSHTLYDTEQLLAKCPKGEPPTVYNSFLKIAASLGPPAKPTPRAASRPDTRAHERGGGGGGGGGR